MNLLQINKGHVGKRLFDYLVIAVAGTSGMILEFSSVFPAVQRAFMKISI